MPLRIPKQSDLDREQREVLNLPLTGRYLVAGPPGSGKSILALWRAAMFGLSGRTTVVLTHNRALARYMDQAAFDHPDVRGSAWTVYDWLKSIYARRGRPIPTSGTGNIDWSSVQRDISVPGTVKRFDHLVLDEGQDFPGELYLVLPLIADSITVFADENQRLFEDNTTLRDIEINLGVDATYMLRRNHRNTLQIASVASQFYAGASTGIPELPRRQGPLPRALKAKDLMQQVGAIARYSRNHPDIHIGVICPDKDAAKAVSQLLKRFRLGSPLQTPDWGGGLDFRAEGALIVASYNTVKGLEFDAAVLVALEDVPSATALSRMRLYVALARPKDELFLLYSGSRLPTTLEAIPPDLVWTGVE